MGSGREDTLTLSSEPVDSNLDGNVTGKTTLEVFPKTTTTYTLTAANTAPNPSTEDVIVKVIEKPTITFKANPPSIDAGKSTILSWEIDTTGAEDQEIKGANC